MKLGLRGKLLLGALALVGVGQLAAQTYLSRALERRLFAQAHADLAVRVHLAAVVAERSPYPVDDRAGWDALADDLGRRGQLRVTIVRADGAVLGDSEVALAALDKLENHRERPEVRAALDQGEGEATRLSVTVQRRMLYLATPLRVGGRLLGVVRGARALDSVEAAMAELRASLLWAGLLAIGVAAVVASAFGRRVAMKLDTLTRAARRLTAGELDVRTRVSGGDELGQLGSAFDQLATNLTSAIRALEGERDLMGGVLGAMQEGVLVLESDGRIRILNPAARDLLEISGTVSGRLPLEAFRQAELADLIDRARKVGQPTSVEIELGGARVRRVLVHAVPFPGSPPGLLAVFVDLTELRRLESVRRDFVTNVSHELRTPVAAILSAAETLRGPAASDPAAQDRFTLILQRNAERLGRLIEDLLDLSRIESRQYRLELSPLEVAPVIEQTVALLRPRAEDRKIEVRLRPSNPLPRVRADQRALEQILTNLIDNAIKYCPEGSTIEVGAAERAGVVVVSVADDGPGIEPRHLPRLFERFYRVDPGRSRAMGGTGLGLAIVKHLAEAMDGRVEVQSTVGQGTRFLLSLPRAG